MELDPDQQAAIDRDTPALRVDAGPGSGKTEVLARRAARIIKDRGTGEGVVLLTYTRSMAGGLRRRVQSVLGESDCRVCDGGGAVGDLTCSACTGTGRGQMAAEVGTLHGLAAKWIGEAMTGELGHDARAAVMSFGWLRTEAGQLLIADDEDVRELTRLAQKVLGRPQVSQCALADGLSLDGAAGDLEGWPRAAELRRQLWQRNLLTYDDLLVMFGRLIESVAWGERYPVVLLDERQDLAAHHVDLLRRWAPSNLTVVGDDAQSIFAFLGLGGGDDGAADIKIGTNYRSGRDIVALCNRVRARLHAAAGCSELVQTPRQGASPGRVTMSRGSADVAVYAVQAHLDAGFAPSNIAVIGATWGGVGDVAAALTAAGVRACVPRDKGRKAWRGVSGRCVVGMARAALRRGEYDEHDYGLIFRAAGLNEGRADLVDLAYQREAQVRSVLDAETGCGWWRRLVSASDVGELAELLRVAADRPDLIALGASGIPDAKVRAMALDRWASSRNNTSVAAWVAWLASAEPDEDDECEGVTCRTIHSAKGLQWPVVIVVDADEGGIPPRWAKDSARLEWGRALYVALSRAQDALVVVAPRGDNGNKQPVEWLRDEEWS